MHTLRKHKKTLGFFIGLALSSSISAKPFIVDDIRVEGLQRVAVGTAFNYISVEPGESVDLDDSDSIISNLYRSHLFSDVELEKEGSTLVVEVTEFPVIGEINFEGNSTLSTSGIKKAFTQVGFAEGQPYDPAMLQEMINQLYKQYQDKDKYQTKITAEVEDLPRGRVAVNFTVSEGRTGTVEFIDFTGNNIYSDEELKNVLDVGTTNFLSLLTQNNKISQEQLAKDTNRLKEFYFNRGFIDFDVLSVEKRLNTDKTEVTLQINVSEGNTYKVASHSITGNLILSREELEGLVALEDGETYNKSLSDKTITALQTRLADEGYAFAKVTVVPDIDRLTQEIKLNFVVDPGQLVTVRRIEFTGNAKTYDAVLRREMIQDEMSPYSASDIARSEARLRKLPQVSNLQKSLKKVDGTPDQVDLVYKIDEKSTRYIQGGVGYGQESGGLLSASYSDDNFLGTGDQLGIALEKGTTYDNYSIDFTDPYFTASGISASYKVYYSSYDYDENDLSDWVADTLGASVTFGYPITEYQKIYYGFGYRQVRITEGSDVASEISTYLDDYGTKYNEFTLNTSWQKDTTNNAYMPSKGAYNSIGLNATTPGSDAEYYQLSYTNKVYYSGDSVSSPIFDFHAKVKYGAGYGGGDYGNNLPFYRKYYAGGLSTVRGFSYGAIGPTYSNGDSAGGDFLVSGGIELMQPISFNGRVSNFRLGVFLDAGTVTEDASEFGMSDMRYSTGAFVQWRSPIGPLNLSYGIPLNDKSGEDTEAVQFTIGTSF